jgi:hypothetical protein
VFENMALRRVFGLKREEITGGSKKKCIKAGAHYNEKNRTEPKRSEPATMSPDLIF